MKIFYVGKGCESRFSSNKGRNSYWNKIVKKHGFTPEIISYWDTETEALDHEEFLIWCFGDMGAPLTNVSIHDKYVKNTNNSCRRDFDKFRDSVKNNESNLFRNHGHEVLVRAIERNGNQRNLSIKYGLAGGVVTNWKTKEVPKSWAFYFAINYYDENEAKTSSNKYVVEAFNFLKGEENV